MKKILLLLASLAVAVSFAGCDGKDALSGTEPGAGGGSDIENPEDPDVPADAGYAIGDYYEGGFVKGIVFYVDETGKHGYVMSLDEKSAVWSYRNENVMNGIPSENGRYNTDCVHKMSGWQEYYPGFAWAEQKNVMGLDNWYVPSSYEMMLIYTAYTGHAPDSGEASEDYSLSAREDFSLEAEDSDAKGRFNACITDRGGDPLRDVLYWTSGEMGPSLAYVFDMGSGKNDLSQSRINKSNEYPFRAISRF